MHFDKSTPPDRFQASLVPVLQKTRSVYIFWYSLLPSVPKPHRYTLAGKIDSLFIELIEMIASASFVKKQDKVIYLRTAIRKLDTLKILLHILWDTRSLDTKKYERISVPLDEIGKMLGGWLGQVEKQNPPTA
jgi:23S rRNA-intervening sequence protein